MGMSATILAIGPFSPAVAPHLGYPAVLYKNTRPGTRVVVELFGYAFPGSGPSKRFATTLGISDPWDFNEHQIDPTNIDADALRAVLTGIVGGEEYLADVESLLVLRDHRFELLFLPNG